MARTDGEKRRRERFLPTAASTVMWKLATSTVMWKLATFSFFLRKQLGAFYTYNVQTS